MPNDSHPTVDAGAQGEAEAEHDAQRQRLFTLLALGRWADVSAQGAALRAAGDVDAWVCHLAALSGQDNWQALRREAGHALARWPQDPRLHLLAGQAWLALGFYRRAAQVLQQGLALAPDLPGLLGQLARAQVLQGDAPAALHTLAKAQALQPGDPTLHLLLAFAQVHLGDHEAAARAAQAALRLAPDQADALALLGQLARPQSRTRALQLARQALQRPPTDSLYQRHYLQLQRGWWWDVAAAGAVVLATAARAWDGLGSWAFAAAALAVLAVGLRLQRHSHRATLAGYCLAVTLASMWHAPKSAPEMARQHGWQAVQALDLLAFALGTVVVAALLAVLLVLAHAVAWHGLRGWASGLAVALQAARQGLGTAYLGELLARRQHRVALLVAAGAALPALPPLPLTISLLSQLLLLPPWAWACSRLLCPNGPRLPPALVSAVLGFPLMLASVAAYDWVGDSAWRQAALAAGLGLYALTVTPPLQRMSA